MKNHCTQKYHVAVILGAILLLSACSQESSRETALAPLPVKVSEVRTEAYLAPEEVMGSVASGLKAVISAKLSARVLKVLVVPGQKVSAGDTLIELDAESLRARRDQARALYEQSSKELARFQSLVSTGAITKQEYDSAEAKAKVAEASLHEAETALNDTRIRSPYGGVITKKLTDLGDMTAPSKPLLEMEDPSALRFESDVPESLMDKIVIGEPLDLVVGPANARYQGKVIEISPSADENTRTFRIKLSLPSDQTLRSGQFGRLFIPSKARQIIRVPKSALLERGQMQLVFIEKIGVAELRLVRTGKHFENSIEILAGLSQGERLIISDAQALKDGSAVVVDDDAKQ